MSAIDTFRRAMRRHEKRARRMGLRDGSFGTMRQLAAPSGIGLGMLWPWEEGARRRASFLRSCPRPRRCVGLAFLYERAADAVARLRDGLRREREAAEQEWADYPYVCPECYCVGPEPHAPGCDEALRELPFGADDDEDDGAHDPCDIECIFCGFPTFDCQCDPDDDGDDL